MANAVGTPALPDEAASRQVITDYVHRNAFLERMAELGHHPMTKEAEDDLVDLGFMIAGAEAQAMQKGAAQNQTFYGFAKQALGKFLGVPTTKQASTGLPGVEDISLTRAFEVAQHPTIYACALVMKQAQMAREGN